jgi:glycine/D-amino acid oxidase-like deaminating enzyme
MRHLCSSSSSSSKASRPNIDDEDENEDELKRLTHAPLQRRCSEMSRIIIVGAGINGVTAAIELKNRGHEVVLVDPGPLPHALAASTDISKAVRTAYGADEDYTALAERSIKDWRKWNEDFGAKLYHEVGVMFVRRREM